MPARAATTRPVTRSARTWRALLACLSLALGRCTAEDGAGVLAVKDTGGPTKPLDVPKDLGTSTDTAAIGPSCQDDADCSGVFVALDACELARCEADLVSGKRRCVRVQRQAFDPCDDGDPCTTGTTCGLSGQCGGGEASPCPSKACNTAIGCRPEDGTCEYAPVADLAPCDDGDACTAGDRCVAGACLGVPDAAGCACGVDADCVPPSDKCLGTPKCLAGKCSMYPVGGISCAATSVGPCETATCNPSSGACVVGSAANGTSCDDGNPCTVGDTCSGGSCKAGAGSCPCKPGHDEDCLAFEDADLCNGLLRCGPTGTCELDPSTVPHCDDDANDCLVPGCVASTGLCVATTAENGTSCSDGDPCTPVDVCLGGTCKGEGSLVCELPKSCGGLPCSPACWNVGACVPLKGCAPVTVAGPCSDGKACHVLDFCQGGACAPGVVSLQCDDENPCTIDACDDGAGCVFTPQAGTCDDGDPCTTGDHCEQGQCAPLGAQACDDGNPCTTGLCIPGTGCVTLLNAAPCEDGDLCTQGDQCQGGKCRSGAKICPCDEDADCSTPGAGTCGGVWHCIANQCVLESAVATGCPGATTACRVTVCDAVTGHCGEAALPDGTPCADATLCTLADKCLGGTCVGSGTLVCDDLNPCTIDKCSATLGCTHQPSTAPCDDSDACTAFDTCKAGACVGGKQLCDCRTDGDCAEPDPCVSVGRCIGNVCVSLPGIATECVAPGPCFLASCAAGKGTCTLSVVADGTPCEDGNACTVSETCAGGRCLPPPGQTCDDGSPCTVDVCDAELGCTHVGLAGPCNDGSPCTQDDACDALTGTCGGVAIASCEENCANGLDDDQDGLPDCGDASCATSPACQPCATAPFIPCGGTVTGTVPAWGSATSSIDVLGCFGAPEAGAPEVTRRFTTSTGGNVLLQLLSSDPELVASVLTMNAGACDAWSCKASGTLEQMKAVPGATYAIVIERLLPGPPADFTLQVACDKPCVPSCAGAACGPNGCGGSCGPCTGDGPCAVASCEAGACLSKPLPGCCTSAADCGDGNPCTQDACVGAQCTHAPTLGCCVVASDCDDGVLCTSEACVDGSCLVTAPAGCCATASDCPSANEACVTTQCIAGTCVTAPRSGCCKATDDCGPAPLCTTGACVDGTCTFAATPGCCTTPQSCGDDNTCTLDSCDTSTLTCSHTWMPGCCASVADCPAPQGACAQATCTYGRCGEAAVPGCCTTSEECPVTAPCAIGVCDGGTCATVKKPGCCQTDAACADGLPCTRDLCLGETCAHLAVLGCCATAADCDDANTCTTDACNQVTHTCTHTATPGCCQRDPECADTDPCTRDRCVGAKCQHELLPGCCATPSDCAPGTCVKAGCIAGKCLYEAIIGCCTSATQCTTGSACVTGQCIGAATGAGSCVLAQDGGCCDLDSDCPVPDDPCEVVACQDHTCTTATTPACCATDAACPKAAEPCLRTRCLGHACVAERIDGCCTTAIDCGLAPPCMSLQCLEGECRVSKVPDCCSVASDCTTPASPCQAATCVDGSCVAVPVPGCCTKDTDCDVSAGAPCALVACALGSCLTVGHVPGCCQSPADCPVPTAPCSVAQCVAGQCAVAPLPGCCIEDGDCGVAAGVCATAQCVGGQCELRQSTGCCALSSDCPDDGNACTTASCIAGRCVHEPGAGCCTRATDCAAATACDVPACVAGACLSVPASDCCTSPADCAALDAPCHEGACLGGRCATIPLPGCCTQDADCPEDPDPCTRAICSAGQCTWSPNADTVGCCHADLDCGPGATACDRPHCVDGACQNEPEPGCALGALVHVGFEPDAPASDATTVALSGGFVLDPAMAFDGTVSAGAWVASGTSQTEALLALPTVHVLGPTTLRFRYRLTVAGSDCDSGRLSVRVAVSGVPLEVPLFERCLPSAEPWVLVDVALGGFIGLVVSPTIRLDSGNGGWASASVDDIALFGGAAIACKPGTCPESSACTLVTCANGLCSAEPKPACCATNATCDDSDPCTSDTCTGQLCVSVPIPGCLVDACAATGFEPTATSAVPWSVTTEPAASGLAFVVEADGAFGGAAFARVTSDAETVGSTAELGFGTLLTTPGPLRVRLATKQALGPSCELGSVEVRLLPDGPSAVLPCGTHDWQLSEAILDVPTAGLAQLAVRFLANAPGADLAVDDVRVIGHCRPVTCVSAGGCDDGDSCTVDACDAGYLCQHVRRSGCCTTSEDCPSDGSCRTRTCTKGRCGSAPTPGCPSGAVMAESFEGGTLGSVTSSVPISGPTGDVVVELGGAWDGLAALRAQTSAAQPEITLTFPSVLVGGDSALAFGLRVEAGQASCTDGRVEFWVDDVLVLTRCASNAAWEPVDVPLTPWLGQLAVPRVRLIGGAPPATATVARVDGLRVLGAAVAATCLTATHCDDGDPCTGDVCLGLSCAHLSSDVSCSDGNACTLNDACVAGACVGAVLACADGDPCTADACDPSIGCTHAPVAAPCDDGDACTADDQCGADGCRGTPVICDDFNACTRDACLPTAGCGHVAEPFGRACVIAEGAGFCAMGQCRRWTVAASDVDDTKTTSVRVNAIAPRATATPLTAIGTYDPDGAPHAVVFRIDDTALGLHVLKEGADGGELLGLDGGLAVGRDGLVEAVAKDGTVPQPGLMAGLDLHVVLVLGQALLLAGDGPARADVPTSVRRCKLNGGIWQKCQPMLVANSATTCTRRAPFHVRTAIALGPQKVLLGGTAFEGAQGHDPVARVALWDGNLYDDCGAAGEYAGEAYYGAEATPFGLTINETTDPTQVEGITDFAVATSGTVLLTGRRGLIAWHDGSAWIRVAKTGPGTAFGLSQRLDLRAMATDLSGVHALGEAVGLVPGGCRVPVHVHLSAIGSGFDVDLSGPIAPELRDCGAPPYDFVSVRGAARDGLTGAIHAVGSAPNAADTPAERRGLVLRLPAIVP